MKLIALLLFTALLSPPVSPPAPSILAAMADKLTALKSLSYQSQTEISNKKDNYFSKFSGDSYLEFNQIDQQTVAKFQLSSPTAKLIYNGTEFFTLELKEKSYTVKQLPAAKSFSGLTFFFNSIQTLRSVVRQIIKDDGITKKETDTTLVDKTYKMVTLAMHKSSLEYLGSTMHFTTDIIIYYKLIIDPATYLPYQIIESNNLEGDQYFTRTVFSNINPSPKEPAPLSWYYSTYQKEFKPEKKKTPVPLITAGSELPDWALPDFANPNGPKLQKADFKGKLVLMDFWIKNCGYCMASFPHLQALQKKYGAAGFQLLAVNAYDEKDDIAFFFKREKPVYKMLYTGEPLAKQLGVEDNGYPTVILADRSGKIIYAGDFDHEKLDKLIRENI